MGFLNHLLTAALAVQTAYGVSLTVSTSGGNASSPYLYGLMFEDINNSGDGVLYGQMLKNNGFQGDNPGIDPFAAVGQAKVSQDNGNTVGRANHPTVLVKGDSGATGSYGVSNAGYNGIRVIPQTYASYFFLKGTYHGDVTVSLVSASDGTVFGSTKVSVSSNANSFTYYQTSFPVSTAAPNGNNLWQMTFDSAVATDGQMNVGFPSLYPPTFHERFNGLNNEVADAMDAIGGSFLRFPGGNNIEGSSVEDRWIWNNTIGLLEDRPGRQGDWGYPNTDGLGLLEYMQWTIDMNLTPVLAIWSGLTLGGGCVTGDDLTPYVQEAMDELEFLLGDSSTAGGQLRASFGYPDPFEIPFVEVGNEDFLNAGADSYPDRFKAFYNAIHAKYPDITLIATTAPQNGGAGVLNPVPEGVMQDVHHYLQPDDFVASFNEFDNWDRSQPILVGEYASTNGNDGSRTYWEFMQSSVSEAVYMIGMERNSDVVKMAAFAPILEHFDLAEWSPDLYGFDATYGVTRSTSYFVQQMFASNRGDTIRSVDSDSNFGPVYWVASSKSDGDTYYVKLANYGSSSESVTVNVAGKSSGVLTLLAQSERATNYPAAEDTKPVTSSVSGSNSNFQITLPAWSVAVLALT